MRRIRSHELNVWSSASTKPVHSQPPHPETRVRLVKLSFLFIVLPLAAISLLAACAPSATLNVLTPSNTHSVTRSLDYGSLSRQKLDIYQPAQAAPAAGYPVVVFFYGGSWNSGDRANYAFMGEALASRGVLTLVADYRVYPEVRYPDFLADSAAALAYGLKQASALGGNPKRVFVMGHSAGAYNAAMLALDARWLKAAGHAPTELAGFIGLAGPYDFLPMTNVKTQPVFFHPNYPAGSQPGEYISRSAPRSFIGAAKKDSLVDPQRNSVALATQLQAAGAPTTLKLYDRVNHVTLAAAFSAPLRWLAPVLDDVVKFIEAK
jgi:acetyl esterase/lipase